MAKQKQIWDADFIAALARLREPEGALPSAILFALSDLSRPELEKFAEMWITLPAERRRRIVFALADLAEESIEADFNRIFRYLLDDEDAEVRAHAINGLWEDEDVALINPLIGAMRSDAAARVRATAAESLGRFFLCAETKRIPAEHGEKIFDVLLAVIRNGGEDALVRRRAIESIAYRGDETVRDIISVAYANDDAAMRATAIFAMGRSADPYWRRTIGQELYSPDPQIRYEAARAVGELEYKAAVPRLIALLEDADPEVQTASITALGQIGGKAAKDALIEIIEGDDEILRESAQDALDELEFTQGSEMLLYEMGLADNEAEMLDDELEDLDEEEDDEEEE